MQPHSRCRLTPELAYQTILPSTAYSDLASGQETFTNNGRENDRPWACSKLNPKNRIDSLETVSGARWRIDGCTSLGTQYFTVPISLSNVVPLRIDTFLPHPSTWPLALASSLEINTVFLFRDSRASKFNISQHILRTLEMWSNKHGNFQEFYEKLPFGSRIVFENMAEDVRQIRVQVESNYHLEMQLLSVPVLIASWNCTAPMVFPSVVDISQLALIQQLQDSTALVEMTTQGVHQEIVVFKTLSDAPKYLYQELKVLLSMPNHQNIISGPLHLITKRCRFGGKTAVVGFTLPYHRQGSLRDILPFRCIHKTLHPCHQVKWALQIVKALLHIRDHGPGFYCDLRLDNILLSDSDDVLLIDFEQRGVLPAFAAPEDNYLQYINSLANDCSSNTSIPQDYEELYQKYIKPHDSRRKDVHEGCTSWLCFTDGEREAAEVYMLGRVLWCIFSGVSAPQRELWMEYKYEPAIEFPDFSLIPMELREILKQCTNGWDYSGQRLKRRGRHIVIQEAKDGFVEEIHLTTQNLVSWWQNELEQAKLFLKQRWERMQDEKDRNSSYSGRPSLQMVLEALQRYQSDLECESGQESCLKP